MGEGWLVLGLVLALITSTVSVALWRRHPELSTVSAGTAQADTVKVSPSASVARVLSSQEPSSRRPLKRTTMADVRARYGYTVRVQRDTVPWSDALCAVILKTRAGEKVSREEWRTALKCSPNTLQKHLDAYQARQRVDTAGAEDAARAQRVAREISAHKEYDRQPKGVLTPLPDAALRRPELQATGS